MTCGSRVSRIPGLAPPPVLIFYHIPKTGGVTMQAIVRRCFSPDEQFDPALSPRGSALWVRSTAGMAEEFHKLPVERQRAVRCVYGEHIAMDVAGIFDRPSKFFTIVREPIDRVISNFHYGRTRPELPSYPYIKDMTLEEYLDSGMGLDHDNHQVRMLSGCPELDSPWGFKNGRIHVSARPVKRCHLEMAKRNIEEHFIVATPLEKFTHLVWFLKRLYGWPTHLILFGPRNETPNRPPVHAVSKLTRNRLETLNRYDTELYEWVTNRFMNQIQPLEPNFSREVRRFELFNCPVRCALRVAPRPFVDAMKRLLVQHSAAVS